MAKQTPSWDMYDVDGWYERLTNFAKGKSLQAKGLNLPEVKWFYENMNLPMPKSGQLKKHYQDDVQQLLDDDEDKDIFTFGLKSQIEEKIAEQLAQNPAKRRKTKRPAAAAAAAAPLPTWQLIAYEGRDVKHETDESKRRGRFIDDAYMKYYEACAHLLQSMNTFTAHFQWVRNSGGESLKAKINCRGKPSLNKFPHMIRIARDEKKKRQAYTDTH